MVPNAEKCASKREFDCGCGPAARVAAAREHREAVRARCLRAAGARTAPRHGPVFFLSGQTKIDGPGVPIQWTTAGIDVSVTLPAAIRQTTLQLFETQYTDLPMTPVVAAYLFSYAEFVLPICLLLGFATRFAAVGLLALTMLLQIYVTPAMWWSLHVYWVSILMVLVLLGPGAISIDALIRTIYLRDRRPARG